MISGRGWKDEIKPLLNQPLEVLEIYGDGKAGNNEVSRARLANGEEVVVKIMLASKKYHQRRKALTEVTMYRLGHLIGGDTVTPKLYAELFELIPTHPTRFAPEGDKRTCIVVRQYVPAQPGDEWRGEVYSECGNLEEADRICQSIIETHPDAERISILDFLTINQDRSARNWVTDHGNRFYAIDNGMAWFHEYPESDEWRQGCVVDDVLLQVKPWQFISGVFTTSWAGRSISPALLDRMANFDEQAFLGHIEQAALDLGFPPGLSGDWRFEGILRRLRWMVEQGRQPNAEEYRAWHRGSELMTPPEIVATGGKVVWNLEMDFAKATGAKTRWQ